MAGRLVLHEEEGGVATLTLNRPPLRARELMYSGRVVEGREAAAIGLANSCVADDVLEAETRRLAESLVASSWHTLRADKMLINGGPDRTLAKVWPSSGLTARGPAPT